MSGERQAVVKVADILGGRGRQLEASREGRSQQHVEVKVTTDQGKPVKGPNGVVGWIKDHEVVSKKVSYKVAIDCCFISQFIAGVNFATVPFLICARTISILCRSTS